MTTLRLSPLDIKNGSITPPNAAGRWSPIKSLQDVAAALDLNVENLDLSKVKSVPDVWAQTASFGAALLKKDHPAHEDAVDHWRGLLAVLGLRRIDDRFRVTLTPVDIEALARNAEKGEFIRVAYDFRPSDKRSLDAKLSWSGTWIISVDGVGVGMLSPETIVAPLRTDPELGERIPAWLSRAPGDPSQLERDPERRAAFNLFLGELVAATRASENGAFVVQLLEDFVSDMANGSTSLAAAPKPEEDRIGVFPEGSLFSKLNKVWVKGEITGAASDAFLETAPSLEGLFQNVVIADADIATSLGADPANLILWNRWRFSDFDRIDEIRDHAFRFKQACLVVTKDDLFAPALAPIPTASITAHMGGTCAKAILPVTPLALLLFGADQIVDNLKLREDSKGRWVANLKIKLRRNDGSTVTHTLAREYVLPGAKAQLDASPGILMQDSSGTVTTELPMTLGAWPDFTSLHWRWNFLYFYTDYLTAAVPTSGISVEALREDIASVKDPGDQWRRLLKWGSAKGRWSDDGVASAETDDGARPWFDRIRISRGRPGDNERPDQELQRSDFAFEGVAMTVYPELFNFPDDIGPMHVGIALLPRPDAPGSVPEDRADIAIDFGTTNTTVYKRHRGQKEHVAFANRLRTLVSPDDEAGKRRQREDLFAAFFPARTVMPPFMTVMQDRSFGERENYLSLINQYDSPAMWRDYVYFDQENANAISTIFEANKGLLHFGIKWSTDDHQRRRIERFLRQVGLMTAAELAATGVRPIDISWNFSYPEAMSDSDVSSFKSISHRVADEVRRSSVEARETDGSANVNFYTESQAAAMEFLNRPETRPAMLVVLDVGGGTTDVSVWSKHDPIWRDSFKIAGRELIIEFIVRNRDFLKNLNAIERLLSNEQNRQKFLAESPENDRLVNAAAVLINSPEFGRLFDENFPHVSGTAAGQKLQAGALLVLGGLMYFIGLQIRGLRKSGKLKSILDTNLETLTVGFAGRGATLFNMFRTTEDEQVNELAKRVLNLFAEGAGLEQSDIRTLFSRRDKVKHEVASGMLPMPDDPIKDLEADPLSDATVIGEWIERDSGHDSEGAAGLEPIDLESKLRELEGVDTIVSNEFDKFLNLLEEKGRVRINRQPSAITHLEVVATDAVERLIKNSGDEHFDPDPPFLIMLRETLMLLYRSGVDGEVTAKLLD